MPVSAHGVGVRLATPVDGSSGGVDVEALPSNATVVVSQVMSSGALRLAGIVTHAAFAPGDVLGARLYADGQLQVYRNRDELGAVVARTGGFGSGTIGIVADVAAGAVLDDFGGGDIVSANLAPPVAEILAPLDHSFYAAGDTIRLSGTASTGLDTLTTHVRWQVDTHHNNHVHPGTFVSSRAADAFVGANHDDGTGVFLRANFIVTRDGLSDSAYVDLFPRVDLVASPVVVTPAEPEYGTLAHYTFAVANAGPMLAPTSRWVLQVDGAEVAHGDTLVQPLSNDAIDVVARTTWAPGTHALRLTLDSLQKVFETDETNDAWTQALVVQPHAGPQFVVSPAVMPQVILARVAWTTAGRARGVVRYGTTLLIPDSVTTRTDSTVHRVAIRGLLPETRYYFSVRAIDSLSVASASPVDSFTTLPDTSVTDFTLSEAFPNPSPGVVRLSLALPLPAPVDFDVYDLQGRAVWSDRGRKLPAGRASLAWPGTDAHGEAARTGVYWARVAVAGRTWTRRVLLVR